MGSQHKFLKLGDGEGGQKKLTFGASYNCIVKMGG